jgi:predicted transcriptional regulator
MQRILIDLPETQLAGLAGLAGQEKRPRAAIIRDAIAAYVAQHSVCGHDVFGLWKSGKADGLAYQQELRAEW